MAEPFATLYTTSDFQHPRTHRIFATAAINNLSITTPSNFTFPTSNKDPSYVAKFPLGKIPALETRDGFLLTEASAITHYLALSGPKATQLLGSTNEGKALVQQWISFADGHLLGTVTALCLPYLGLAVFDHQVEVEKTNELERWFDYIETYLEGQKKGGGLWLVHDGAGEGPSLADVTVGAALVLGCKYWIDGEFRDRYQCIMGWFGRLLKVEEIREGFGDIIFLRERKVLGCEVTS